MRVAPCASGTRNIAKPYRSDPTIMAGPIPIRRLAGSAATAPNSADSPDRAENARSKSRVERNVGDHQRSVHSAEEFPRECTRRSRAQQRMAQDYGDSLGDLPAHVLLHATRRRRLRRLNEPNGDCGDEKRDRVD